jgi:hypothetical protein
MTPSLREDRKDDEPKSRAPIILGVGAVAALLVIAGIYLVGHFTPATTPVAAPEKALPMGPAEQAYAQQIHFSSPTMGRAANFLNQEVTFIFGTVSNDGPRAIRQIEITVEFRDPFNQVVLRDTQRLFNPAAGPLAPNDHQDFQLSYETLPATWAQTYPTIHISGLDLQ